MEKYNFLEIEAAHRLRLEPFIRAFWGSNMMVSRGRAHYPARQRGFLAEKEEALSPIL